MPRTPQHIAVDRLPRESLLDGTYQRVAVRGDHSLVTYNWMDPGMPRQALHSHGFDQVSLVVQGAMEFTVDGRTYLVETGHALVIPADAPHTAVAVGEGVALNIDVYAPPRADYLHLAQHQGTDFPDPVELTAAETAAVTGLLTEWCDRLDRGDAAGVADLVTDDAVVLGLGPDRRGPEGLRQWAATRPTDRRTRHRLGDLHYAHRADGAIAGTASVVVHAVGDEHPEPRTDIVAEYRDTILRTPAGLRFARREIWSLR